MVGDSHFAFQSTDATRFTVAVGTTSVRIEQVTSAEGSSLRREKTWDMPLADIKSATVFDWRVSDVTGEAIYLRDRRGMTAMFMSSSFWLAQGRVSKSDQDQYLAATAALFKALAIARPQIRIRKGRPPGWKLSRTLFLAGFAVLLSALFLWQTGGWLMNDDRRTIVVAAIFVMTVLYGIYRAKLLSPVSFADVHDVATWMAGRAPVTGPWGAVR